MGLFDTGYADAHSVPIDKKIPVPVLLSVKHIQVELVIRVDIFKPVF